MEKTKWDTESDFLKPYSEKMYDTVHKNIIEYCEYFRELTIIDDYDIKNINEFVGCLFFSFSREDFKITAENVNSYFKLHHTIANLIRISSYKNSDTIIRVLMTNPLGNLVKILVLYSAYNTIFLERKTLLSINPKGVSLWFCNFISSFQTALADADGYKQLQYHLRDISVEIKAVSDIKPLLFAPTYIDHLKDRFWKSKFNSIIQENNFLEELKPSDENYKKNKTKIAIISGTWHKNHSVYRNQYDFLKALSKKYELSLFSVEPLGDEEDNRLFKEAYRIVNSKGEIELPPQLKGGFPLIYFTDIGLNAETTILSNTRLAPIQVTSYGHPVSTFGGKIDYWIGGLKGEQGTTELDTQQIQSCYSEKFIGLPGLGITNTIPDYTLKNIAPREDYFIINCSWCAHKVNYELIKSLQNVLKRAQRQNVVFRFFSCTYALNFITFRHVILENLGHHAEVIPAISYQKYMELMEEGQFGIEAYPFGGCNTIVDSLWLGQPIVCWEGDRWYGKIGTAIMREAGIDLERKKLLAANQEQYENYIVNLIDHPELLEAARKEIAGVDLKKALFEDRESNFFVTAIDSILSPQ